MRVSRTFFLNLALAFLVVTSSVRTLHGAEPVRREWQVDGVSREALISIPDGAKEKPVPLVFAFHGHGGNMRQASRSFQIHAEWPEAIVVYMQGLNTPGQLTDPEGKKPGWQKAVGDQNDRDLHFFDAVLKSLKEDYRVDETRIYSTGHSNGGGFTYLLWSARPDVFAAMAPSGSAALKLRGTLKPLPVFHIAGENDPLVRYAWQSMMIESLRKDQKCGEGKPWNEKATLYPSEIGTPVVTYITNQGHKFPADAPGMIVKFFKEHSKKTSDKE
ncbi:MAG: acetylxylan esterase [Planctomycetaceae bacterium]|nr:acetylxylan esterase [Planctomycetaceae bacterium]